MTIAGKTAQTFGIRCFNYNYPRENPEKEIEMAKQKVCFIISAIGESHSTERKHADKVQKYIVKPILDQKKYKSVRADEITRPGMIVPDIIEHLQNAELVIADLSFQNPNVYYELAIRHGLTKHVITIIHKTDKIMFDLYQSRTIMYGFDIEEVEDAKSRLQNAIEEIELNPDKVDNPISLAFNTQQWSSSKDPIIQTQAQILKALHNIEGRINTLEQRIAPQIPFIQSNDGSVRIVALDEQKQLHTWMSTVPTTRIVDYSGESSKQSTEWFPISELLTPRNEKGTTTLSDPTEQ